MKYIKYSSVSLLVILIIITTSCKESFLDLKPIAKPTTETYYTEFSSIDATCVAAYGELCAREVFDKDYYLVVGSIPSDDVECGGENINDYSAAQHYDQFVHDMTDAMPLEEIWRYCYKGLRFANTVLDYMPIAQAADSTVPESLFQQRTAEMKFMRGLYHFMLMQVFGGVPIADHIMQTVDYSKPRNSIKEVLDFIQKDLKDAIPYLPTKSQLKASNEGGRASKGAAQALLAKAIIYESSYAKNYPGDERFTGCVQHWQEALDYANEVINATADYSLVSLDGERKFSWRTGKDKTATIDGYRWLFTADADNSSESIFEIQNVDDGMGWGITRGNLMTVYQTVRWCTSSAGTQTVYGGWSFNCPTPYLVNAFRNSDPRESNLHSAPCNETDDVRFATTVGREGDSSLFHSAANVWVKMDLSNLPNNMIGRKFECGWDEYWGGNNDVNEGPFNVRLFRLADLMLLAAEAAFEVGSTDIALNYVNKVRERARNCGTSGKPEALATVSMEDIMHERRLELTLEPHRFFDLVRWNKTKEFLETEIDARPGFTVTFQKGKHEFWPIPQSEIDYSKGGLVQYPGWK
jgi:starch-binding outer membrane protein, SusD/RagB family